MSAKDIYAQFGAITIMSKIAEQIKNPIAEEMQLFEDKFYQAMKSKVALLDRITQFIVKRKGKQMRPMFVFLCANLKGETTEKTYRAASLIELIHTATLVHDDVVDESHLRRGFFSINALWKNKIAILVGDYLLSKSVLLSTDHKDYDLLEIISQVIREMSEGELLQLEKARKLDITEEVYYQIIQQKTASLIAACCKAGSISSNPNQEDGELLEEFGMLVGKAFQIKDDLFDYTSTNIIGKPIGIDIKEKKMTLPLIYALGQSTVKEKAKVLKIIKSKRKTNRQISEVIDFVKEKGGLSYAIDQMNNFKDEALEILERFPNSDYKDSLELMVNYVTERSN